MSSDKSSESAAAVRTQGGYANRLYDLALPAMNDQYRFLNSSIREGGEPNYLRDAFTAQRTGIVEGLSRQGLLDQKKQLGAGKAAAAGGNALAGLTPQTMGAQIADQMYSSRVNEGLGKVEQLNKLMAMGLGQSTQAQGAAVGAGGLQLQGIAGLPAYNSTYATALGIANLGATAYGGYQGWRAGQPGAQPYPGAAPYYSSLSPQPGMNFMNYNDPIPGLGG